MIVRAQKKPAVVDVVKYDGNNFDEVRDFVGEVFYSAKPDGSIEIYEYILGQWQVVPVGAFIIKGTKVEFYACSHDVFLSSYDIIERAADAAS
jgi:hypothetical protein